MIRCSRAVAIAGVLALVIFPPVPGQQPEQARPAGDPVSDRVSSGDWGVTLDALRTIRAAGHQDLDTFTNALRGALWARRVVPAGELSTFDLGVQGSYNWSTGQTYLNLDRLRAVGRYPELLGPTSVAETTVGRFRFQDPSGLVLNHVGDGLSAGVAYPRARLRFSALYTGFLLNPVSTVRMTGTDLLEEDDDDEDFGPRRVVGLAELSFPALVARQTLVTGAAGQYDLRDAGDGEETVHSGYAVLGIRGRLFGSLYHDVYAVGTAGTLERDENGATESEDFTGYLGSARLRLFLPGFFASRLSLQGVYASRADANNDLIGDGYLPISRTRLGTVVRLPLQNLLFTELSYSMRPFFDSASERARRVQVVLTGRGFFTTSDRPVVLDPATETTGDGFDLVGIDSEPAGNIIGTEVVLRINARPLSDLGLGMTTGMFFPHTGSAGVFTGDREPEFLGRVELSTRL